MLKLGGSRKSVISQAKINAAAKKKLQQKPSSLTGNRTGKNIEEVIAKIEFNSQKYLSKYVNKYELIQNEQRAIEYFNAIIDKNIAAIDTETTGLDTLTCKIVGICLYVEGEKPCYMPINHIGHVSHKRSNGQLTEEFIKSQLDRCQNVKWVFHNAKYDIRVLRHTCNVDLTPYWDTMIAARLLNENESAALKNLHLKYCESADNEPLTISKLFDGLTFSLIPIKYAYLYAAGDAIKTWELYQFQKAHLENLPKLAKINAVFRNIEMPLIKVLADMEDRGFTLDLDYAKKLSEQYHKLLKEAEAKCYSCLAKHKDEIDLYKRMTRNHKLSEPISLSSPTQVAILLYDILKVTPKIKNSGRGTGEDVLKSIDHPFCSALLEYRGINKLITTYVDKLPAVISDDGKIHAQFNQYGAACVTGDTLLYTNLGYKRIDEIVRSSNAGNFQNLELSVVNLDQCWEKSDSGIYYENQPVITITTVNGFKLTGTYNHPVMVSKFTTESLKRDSSDEVYQEFWKDRHFKKLEDIQIGDYVEIPCQLSEMNLPYQPTNLVPTEHGYSSETNHRIPEFYTEEFAEFLGMYHADGASAYHEGTYTIAIHSEDKDVIARVTELSMKLFNVRCTHWKDAHADNEFDTYLNSSTLSGIDCILTKGIRNKKIPQEIYSSPSSVINAYIRGLTLASSVYLENGKAQFVLSVADEGDARMLQCHLASQGILSEVRHLTTSEWDSYQVALSADNYIKFCELIGFVESRKYIKTLPQKQRTKTRLGNSFRLAVKKIEYGVADVYDLHVPQTHSFVSNGFISHNTGRLSSSEPNLQNIPSKNKEIRKMFKASEGNYLVSGDFSQQEPRLLAHMSQDENFTHAYMNNRDIYAWCASLVYNNRYEDNLEFRPDGLVNPEGKKRRTAMKSLILGIMYGRGPSSIAEQLGISVNEAKSIITKFHQSFPKVEEFTRKAQDHAKSYGFVETAYGRKRRLPDMRLPEIQLEIVDGSKMSNFDPLDFSNSTEVEISKDTYNYYANKMHKAYGFSQKQKVRDEAAQEGLKIIDNGGKIADAQRQCVNCLSLDTQILTSEGWKYYDEIKKGDKITSFNPKTLQFEKDRIKAIHIYDEGNYECINFYSLKIDAIATLNHRWVNTSGEFKNSDDIKENDFYIYGFLGNSHSIQDIDIIDLGICTQNRIILDKVWCVTTKNGTFIAKRNGKSFVTGNSIIQGSASDVTKKAMIGIANDEKLNQLGFKLISTIHDEVIGECPKGNAFEAVDRLEEVMIAACADEIEIPMKVDGCVNEVWYGPEIERPS